MKKIINSIFAFGLVLTFLTSCSKYDDGGSTFRAEKKIVGEEWVLDTIITTSSFSSLYNYSSTTPDVTYIFNKDGGYTETTILNGVPYVLEGEWELINKAKTLRLKTEFSNPPVLDRRLDFWSEEDTAQENYMQLTDDVIAAPLTLETDNTIIRLKKDELWYSYSTVLTLPEGAESLLPDLSFTYEVHLKKKK